jgi:hypothetical protein
MAGDFCCTMLKHRRECKKTSNHIANIAVPYKNTNVMQQKILIGGCCITQNTNIKQAGLLVPL